LPATGTGAGARELPDRPNILRVVLGDDVEADASAGIVNEVVLLEANVDDLVPELIPDAVDRAFSAGALDVWVAPIQMKKGRPGLVLSAIARPDAEPTVARAL